MSVAGLAIDESHQRQSPRIETIAWKVTIWFDSSIIRLPVSTVLMCFHNNNKTCSASDSVYTNALNAGRHDIGFSFVVPENVPSSLNHLNGQIEYFIKAKVKDLASAHKQKASVTIVASPSVTHNELVVCSYPVSSLSASFFFECHSDAHLRSQQQNDRFVREARSRVEM